MRDCRLGEELSYDDAERELKKELCLVENVKKNLTQRSQAAWEKINRLEEIKFQLNLDLNDKTEALDIDRHQLALDKQSASTTYKMNPTRTPKNSISYDKWLEHTQHVKQQSDNEQDNTLKLCEFNVCCKGKIKEPYDLSQGLCRFIPSLITLEPRYLNLLHAWINSSSTIMLSCVCTPAHMYSVFFFEYFYFCLFK